MKVCKTCGEMKRLAEFYSAPRGLLGREAHCIPCYKARRPRGARLLAYEARPDVMARKAAFMREYRRAHPELMRARDAAKYQKRKPAAHAKQAEWRQRNAERARLYRQIHRANRTAIALGVPGRLTIRDVEYLPLECVYCGATTDLTLDHATSMKRGGTNDWSNLTTACFNCNRRKRDKTPSEFLGLVAA